MNEVDLNYWINTTSKHKKFGNFLQQTRKQRATEIPSQPIVWPRNYISVYVYAHHIKSWFVYIFSRRSIQTHIYTHKQDGTYYLSRAHTLMCHAMNKMYWEQNFFFNQSIFVSKWQSCVWMWVCSLPAFCIQYSDIYIVCIYNVVYVYSIYIIYI